MVHFVIQTPRLFCCGSSERLDWRHGTCGPGTMLFKLEDGIYDGYEVVCIVVLEGVVNSILIYGNECSAEITG